jgi:malate dehydrogenase (oxaloacetate-decarboxylating)
MKQINEKQLLEKANRPNKDAMRLHPFYHGKIEVIPKCRIKDFQDFAIWYTPGVAEPCKEIQKHPLKVYDYTNKWNTVAIVSDGTRVLGLGDIGPEAGLPVMEGKSLLFKYLGGVDAYPICLDTKNPDDIIQAVKWLKPSFGGINLEDIEKPKCFYILNRLRKEMDIPVWHDDQQGTATIVTAGAINALKIVGKPLDNALVSMLSHACSSQQAYNKKTSSWQTAKASCIPPEKTLRKKKTTTQKNGRCVSNQTQKAARETLQTL